MAFHRQGASPTHLLHQSRSEEAGAGAHLANSWMVTKALRNWRSSYASFSVRGRTAWGVVKISIDPGLSLTTMLSPVARS